MDKQNDYVIVNTDILNKSAGRSILRLADDETSLGGGNSVGVEMEPELLGRLMKVMKQKDVDTAAKNTELADIINIIKLKYSGSQVVQNI